jgi:hypothetical protein
MTKSYRVNGRHDFTLQFVRMESSGAYWIFAKRWPTNSYSTSERVTHVNPTTGKICVTRGREPRTLDKAIAIGQLWCKGYSALIDTGTFPNGAATVNV